MPKPSHQLTLDRIKRAIDEDNNLFLTDAERKMQEELLACSSMLLNVTKTTGSIVKTLCNEHGMDQRTAYRRIADAKFIFGDVFSADRAMEKMKATLRAEKAWQLANKQKYVDGMVRANDQIVKLRGLEHDELSAIDPTQLEPSTYKLMLSPDGKKLQRHLIAKGTVDLGQMLLESGAVQEAELVNDDDPADDEMELDDDDDDPLKG